MKKVIAMLAVLGFAGSVASAQVKNFKYDGKLEFHKFYSSNIKDANKDAADSEDDQDYRAQLGLSFEAGENASAQIDLIKTNGFNTVDFGQAYIYAKDVFMLDHKFGRMFYGKTGDLVADYTVAPWYARGMTYAALQGWYGEWKNEKFNVHAVVGKSADIAGTGNGDTNIYGLVGSMAISEAINPTAYAYKRSNIAVGTDDKLHVFGVKANGKFKGFEYYGEYAMNAGAQSGTVDYRGYALMAGGSYGLTMAGKLNLSAEYAMGSGDKASADKDEGFYGLNTGYRPGIIWGGNNAGIRDLTTWNAGAMWTPEKLEKLSVGAKYFHYSPTEERPTYDTYGSEFDLCADWQHTENFGLKGYYAMYMADKDAVILPSKLAGNDDVAYQTGLLATLKF